jgi:drug/metabolite transporter (DMT)-like permease
MTELAFFCWIANVVLDTAGHLAFKRVAVVEHQSEWGRWKKMLGATALWIGIACFVLEFLVWLALLSLVPLSFAVLIGSINIVVVMLAGRALFHERLDRMRVAGMVLISIGVALAGGGA